jgi:molecular chaperone GrpE
MAENKIEGSRDTVEEEFELDGEETEDLEAAMQEALEAVNKASRESRQEAAGAATSEAVRTEERETTDPEIALLQSEIADLRDRSARALADFDNYRKRIERERQEERHYAVFEVLRAFLGVIDNLERAVSSEGPVEDLRAGVELILRQVDELMRSHGVRRVPALQEEFDPRVHEAVSRHEDPEVTTPIVSEELQPGYVMHDRLLRPAIVKVAMPPGLGPTPVAVED